MTRVNPAAQVLDAVDEADRVVGLVRRSEVFRRKSNFRVAHLFLFNQRGELLIQQLAKRRSRHPGCWGSSVAAYVASGERYKDAIVRRARQELGIQAQDLELVGQTSMEEEGCTKFISVFTGCCDGGFSVDTSHISQVHFAPVDEILRAAEMEPWMFTPTFLLLVQSYLPSRV